MSKQVTMGTLGEELFIKTFGGVRSGYEFDSDKDIIMEYIVNDEIRYTHVEVKTQCRFPAMGVFSIEDVHLNKNYNIAGVDNIIKCFNVEKLIFIEYDETDVIKFWECPQPRKYKKYTTNKGKKMIGFPISQMTLIHELNDPVWANKIRSLSQAERFKK